MTGEERADVIWEQTVDDGAFQCLVIRTGDYRGRLEVMVAATGKKLLNEDIGLMFGARWGPDIDDLAEWQEKAIKVIDEYLIESETGAPE